MSTNQESLAGASSSNQEMEAPIVIPPLKEHKATLIFLHGLGDTGHGFAEEFQTMQLKHIKCVFPHAPVQAVTVNRGMHMPSWFDVSGFEQDSPEHEASLKEASKNLQALIESEEKSGIPSSHIFIGGISQGGAVVLYTALAVDRPVGAVVALSTWLPLHKTLADDKVPKYNKDVPVLLCHGKIDPLVKYSWGELINQFIQSFYPKIEFKSYERLAHWICPQEMMDVKAFLEKHAEL